MSSFPSTAAPVCHHTRFMSHVFTLEAFQRQRTQKLQIVEIGLDEDPCIYKLKPDRLLTYVGIDEDPDLLQHFRKSYPGADLHFHWKDLSSPKRLLHLLMDCVFLSAQCYMTCADEMRLLANCQRMMKEDAIFGVQRMQREQLSEPAQRHALRGMDLQTVVTLAHENGLRLRSGLAPVGDSFKEDLSAQSSYLIFERRR
jgi:hypothetical protein